MRKHEQHGGDTRARLQVRPEFSYEYIRNTTNWITMKQPNARNLKKSDNHLENHTKQDYKQLGGDTRARLQVRPVFSLENIKKGINWQPDEVRDTRNYQKSVKHMETTAKMHYERRGGDTRARL